MFRAISVVLISGFVSIRRTPHYAIAHFAPSAGYIHHDDAAQSESQNLENLRTAWVEMKDNFPMNTLTDVIEVHEEMLNIIHSANAYRSSVQMPDYSNYRKHSDQSPRDSVDSMTLAHVNVDLHSDIVFVGFPSTAVEAIRDKWFDNLGREDNIMSSLGPFGDLVPMVGGATSRHHFHLVQVSFHVADAIRDRMQLLLTQGSSDYINAWEMEDILLSLASSVTSSHRRNVVNTDFGVNVESKPLKPTSTIFVLNLDLKLSYEYGYQAGFNFKDLQSLSSDDEIIKLCKDIFKSEKVLLRRESTHEKGQKPLADAVQNFLNDSLFDPVSMKVENSESRNNSFTGDRSGRIHWRDAVRETRTWAKTFNDNTVLMSNSMNIHQRALRILSSSAGEYLHSYRIPLASAILDVLSQTETKELKYSEQINRNNSKDLNASTDCSSGTWIGKNRVMWIDIHANGATPPINLKNGLSSPSTPSPKNLRDDEWLKIGEAALTQKKDLTGEVANARNALYRNVRTASHLCRQSQCPDWDELLQHDDSKTNLEAVMYLGELLVDEYHSGFVAENCAKFLLEIGMLKGIIDSSIKITSLHEKYSNTELAEEMNAYIAESNSLLLRTMNEAIESSSLFSKISQVHVSSISPTAVVYLSHLAASILHIARYFIAPPVALRQNMDVQSLLDQSAWTGASVGQGAGVGKGRDSTLYSTIDISSLLEKRHRDDSTSRNAHVYNGESLLELLQPVSISGSAMDVKRNSFDGCFADLAPSKDSDILHWTLAFPILYTPSRVDIVIYVVVLQSDYKPLSSGTPDRYSFDATSFMSEVLKLKLPNQDMSITIQYIAAAANSESALSLGLVACKRESKYNTASADIEGTAAEGAQKENPKNTYYLDSTCILSHLQHYDETHAAVKAEGGSKYHGASNQRTTGQHDSVLSRSKASIKHSQRLSVFLLSLSTPEPTFLDGTAQAAVNGADSVLIVQNQQVTIPTDITCNGQVMSVLGRNPLGPALGVMAEALGGLPASHLGHQGVETTSASISSLFNLETHLDIHSHSLGDRHLVRKKDVCSMVSATARSASRKNPTAVDPSTLHDWSSFMGLSASFVSTSLTKEFIATEINNFNTSAQAYGAVSPVYIPVLTEGDVDFIHRSRVLRALSVARSLAVREVVEFLDTSVDLTSLGSTDEKSSEEKAFVEEFIAKYSNKINYVIINGMASLNIGDMSSATAYANAAVLLATHTGQYFNVSEYHHLRNERRDAYRKSNRKGGRNSISQDHVYTELAHNLSTGMVTILVYAVSVGVAYLLTLQLTQLFQNQRKLWIRKRNLL